VKNRQEQSFDAFFKDSKWKYSGLKSEQKREKAKEQWAKFGTAEKNMYFDFISQV